MARELHTLVSHSRPLRLAWQEGSNEAAAAIPFPEELDDDLEQERVIVQEALARATPLRQRRSPPPKVREREVPLANCQAAMRPECAYERCPWTAVVSQSLH